MGGSRAAAEAHNSCRPSSGSLANPHRKLRPCPGITLGPGMPPHLQVEGPSPRPCVVTVFLSQFAPLTTEESFLCTTLQVATRKENLDTWEPELEFSSSSKCVVFDCVGAVEKFPLLVRSHLECISYSAPRTEKWVHTTVRWPHSRILVSLLKGGDLTSANTDEL